MRPSANWRQSESGSSSGDLTADDAPRAAGSAEVRARVGVGLAVGALTRTVTRAFPVVNVPFALMMFFSGAIYPLPKIKMFEISGHVVGLWDILPATHAVIALNKILSLGAGLGDVGWELGWLSALSALFFGAGVWIFHRMHLRAR